MIEIAQLAHWPFCKEDLSATLEMTTARSAIKILRRFIIICAAPPFLIPNSSFVRSFQTESKGSTPKGLILYD